MVGIAHAPQMSPAMIRTAFLILIAVMCALGARAVRAQESDADLVTRINRLEATIRNLTGNIEQLQYRNQQLEQQVQRLQSESTPEGARPSSAPPPRPTGQYSPPPATAPGPVVATAPPATSAPMEPAPSVNRRGDAFDPAANPSAPGAPRPLLPSVPAVPLG